MRGTGELKRKLEVAHAQTQQAQDTLQDLARNNEKANSQMEIFAERMRAMQSENDSRTKALEEATEDCARLKTALSKSRFVNEVGLNNVQRCFTPLSVTPSI